MEVLSTCLGEKNVVVVQSFPALSLHVCTENNYHTVRSLRDMFPGLSFDPLPTH